MLFKFKAKLQTAVTCLEKAEQTLGEFRDFLRTEKYKEWNEKQIQVKLRFK